MRKSRFGDAHIMGILRQVEGGLALAEVLREHGISSATFYKWRSNENRRLKKMFAELSMQMPREFYDRAPQKMEGLPCISNAVATGGLG